MKNIVMKINGGCKTILCCMAGCFMVVCLSAQTDSGYLKSFDGTRIYYEVTGKGDPVLLIHGFIVNSQSWKKTAVYTDLIAAGYKVITFDSRGNGKSDKPHMAEAYEHDAEAKDIMALLTELRIQRYSAIGYSRGSIILARLLVLDRNVEKAVIGGMGTDFTNPEWPRRIMFYKALSGEDIPELAGVIKYVHEQGLDQQALAFMQKGQPSTSKEDLAKIKKPVLVLCGDRDADNGAARNLAGIIPGANFKTVPGEHNDASHSKEFSNEVITFLGKK